MARKEKRVILAVDDAPENLDLIKSILEPHYTVKVAISGSLALQIARAQQPDLILLDIMLEDIDGYEVCRQLKADSKTKNIPVLFLTAKQNVQDEVLGFKLGASDYITKPFSPPIILARIDTQLKLKAKTDLLERLVSLDGLTEIPNRRAFDAAFNRQWKQAMRSKQPLSLIIFDLDNFKQYNDHYGHPMGDEALKHVAQALASCSQRPEDLVARLGGEEFVALLPNTDRNGAVILAEKYREAVEQLGISHIFGNPKPYLTVSCGVATAQGDQPDEPIALLEDADDKLYQAKKAGRNQVCAG